MKNNLITNKALKWKINNNIILLIVLAAIVTLFSFLDKNFLTYYNISTMLRNLVITGILALGLTPLMISRGIDVSFGSSLSLATVVIAILYNSGISIYLCMLVAIIITTMISLLNGILIESFKLNALIATLGTMSMYLAIASVISKGIPIGILSEELMSISYNSFLKVPIPLWIFIILILIYYLILNGTVAGRTVYIIGANPQASFSCGIKVKKVRIILYSFFGFMVGIAAILATGFIGTGSAFHGTNMLLPTLSAIMLGGIGLSGGSGNIWGTILGVLIISTIFNGLAIAGVSADKIQLIQGMLLIIIVAVYETRSKRRT